MRASGNAALSMLLHAGHILVKFGETLHLKVLCSMRQGVVISCQHARPWIHCTMSRVRCGLFAV